MVSIPCNSQADVWAASNQHIGPPAHWLIAALSVTIRTLLDLDLCVCLLQRRDRPFEGEAGEEAWDHAGMAAVAAVAAGLLAEVQYWNQNPLWCTYPLVVTGRVTAASLGTGTFSSHAASCLLYNGRAECLSRLCAPDSPEVLHRGLLAKRMWLCLCRRERPWMMLHPDF